MNKNLFKKVISIILVIAMMASMGVYASAAEETTYVGGVLTYTLSTDENGNDVASVVCNDKTVTSVTVPGTITVDGVDYAVTTLGEDCFYNCTLLTNVELADSITTFEDYAFLCCESLKTLVLPSSLTSFGLSAFCYCESLTSISIPAGVTVITDNSFAYCCDLEEVIFEGNNVTSIEMDAFRYCSSLKTILIPTSVNSIGNFAFGFCTSLEKIEIPSSVTKLNYGVFWDCSSLADLYIYNCITYIASSNFNTSEVTTIHYYGSEAQWAALIAIYGSLTDDDGNYLDVGFNPFENDSYVVVYEDYDDTICGCDDCEDEDEDGTCDKCCLLILLDYDFTNGGRCYWSCCDCVCNASTGFGQIIAEICLFFWELFGIHKWCQCGRMHY